MDPIDLTDVVDLHIHTSPDIRPRYADDLQVTREAAAAGMGAILIKSHWTLTADRAVIAERAVGGIRVVGGLALNSTVGWLNPRAVEVALQMGAAQIWMPTLDLAGPGQTRWSGPIVVDAEDAIRPEVYDILELVRDADAILGTGHLPEPETLALVRLARQRGLEKVLVTHPDAAFLQLSLAAQRELAAQGAFFERCYNGFGPGEEGSLEHLAAVMREIGIESTVLSTDYGQAEHPAPVEGFRRYLAGLAALGFGAGELQRMAVTNPSGLLGM
ncbi:MAG: hypothetical protein JXA74_16105 [Anaerolineae bacterium]|nr:hypothetical protein [Anaerolineae bacterium]